MDKREGHKLTEDECLAIGGHCYEQDDWAVTLTCMPPVTCCYRTCKHCGHRQLGRTQPSVAWQDMEAVQRLPCHSKQEVEG